MTSSREMLEALARDKLNTEKENIKKDIPHAIILWHTASSWRQLAFSVSRNIRLPSLQAIIAIVEMRR